MVKGFGSRCIGLSQADRCKPQRRGAKNDQASERERALAGYKGIGRDRKEERAGERESERERERS